MYDENKAERVVRFVRQLRHTKGEWAGKKFTLLPWQEDDILRPLFGTVNKDGKRQYRTCWVEVPKKQGKSELGAAIALYLLCADGEQGAEVYSAACDREQASIVFGVAAEMVRRNRALDEKCRIVDSTKRILYLPTGSVYKVLSSDVKTKHGLNIHGVVADELHAWQGRKLWSVLTQGAGDARSQPLTLVLTTAGNDRNSVCWEMHDYASKIKRGIIQDLEFLPVIYGADDADDWESEEVWRKANPSLGHIIDIEKVRAAYRRAKEIPSEQNEFRQLRLNQWVSQSTRWLPMHLWDASAGKVNPATLRGRTCYAGLDLASTTDLAALVLVFPMDDGTYQVLPYFWIPGGNIREKGNKDHANYELWVRQGHIEATEGNVIHYDAIRRTFEELADLYRIVEVGYDEWGSPQLVSQLQDAGFTVVPIRQGFKTMSAPTKEVMSLVSDGRLVHGGDPVLRWCADNLVVRRDPAGNVKPDREKATQKIDGMVALILAIARATIADPEGEKSIYETRGIEYIDLA